MPAYFLFEVLCFSIAVIFGLNERSGIVRLFVPYLFIIVLYEYGTLQGWFTLNHSNLWAVNFITLIQFSFYSYIIYSFLQNRSNKKYFMGLFVIAMILSILNISFLQGFWRLHSYTILVNALFLIGFLCVYFFELLHNDIDHIDIAKYPPFWIATGILFFYLGQFLFFAFFEYMAYSNDYSYYTLFKVVSTTSNIILYSCLSIAFVCCRLETTKS